MKYLCLVYVEEKTRDSLPQPELDAWIRDDLDYAETLRKSGHFLAAQTLQSTAAATTLRVRSGKLTLGDGPSAETKEQLSGFILVEARDLNEAINAAAKIPGARYGSVEVRPVRESRPARERIPGAGI